MFIRYKKLTIRSAVPEDARILSKWWNDGAVMAHAGFPNGIGTTPEEVSELLSTNNPNSERMLLEHLNCPIGEANYRRVEEGIYEIGIKICDTTKQEKGYGKQILSLIISYLFEEKKAKKIILDTNQKNQRAQHVYEQLGFIKVRTNVDAWKDQLGELQTSIDYELTQPDFVNFAD